MTDGTGMSSTSSSTASSSLSASATTSAAAMWLDRRRARPQQLRNEEGTPFADVTLVAKDARTGQDRQFKAHRYKDYFLSMVHNYCCLFLYPVLYVD